MHRACYGIMPRSIRPNLKLVSCFFEEASKNPNPLFGIICKLPEYERDIYDRKVLDPVLLCTEVNFVLTDQKSAVWSL